MGLAGDGVLSIDIGEYGGCSTDGTSFDVECSSQTFTPPGQLTVNAAYSGFQGTDENGKNCTVPGSTATTVVSMPYGVTSLDYNVPPPARLQVGQIFSVQFSLTIEESYPSATGDIQLFLEGTLVKVPLGPEMSVCCSGDGYYTPTFTASTKGLTPGSYQVSAQYPGDSNYSPAQGGSYTVTLLPAQTATTTTLTVTPNPTVEGQLTSITATVTPTGVTVPSGTVTLLAGSTQIGTITLINGAGTITAPADIAPGTYQVRAIYSGDSFNIASTSPSVSVTVDAQTSTTTSVTVSPSTIAAGATALLTATVTPAISNVVPTGTVTITANGATVATLPLKNGTASEQLSTTGLPAGMYSVVGKYSGSSLATASTSPAAMVTIEAASSVSVVASPNPVTRGNVTTLTATVKNGSGGLVTSGTVTFSYAGSSLGTANVGTNGQASLPIGTSSFANGTYTITASFGGSGSVPAAMGTVSSVVN